MDKVFEKDKFPNTEDFKEGGLLMIDKPIGWTSFDVVNKLRYSIRRHLGVKKYKVGHSGTLDPLATGLLLICFSKYTKRIEELMTFSKSYTGCMTLWATTPSYDAEHDVDIYYPHIVFSNDELEQARFSFLGNIQQYPPVYSAIKKDGVAYYKMARKGIDVDIHPRSVEISKFDLTDVDLPRVEFSVDCSKGTYIRSLAYDFGAKLGSGAYLSELRRTKIGHFDVNNAWTVQDLVNYIDQLPKQ